MPMILWSMRSMKRSCRLADLDEGLPCVQLSKSCGVAQPITFIACAQIDPDQKLTEDLMCEYQEYGSDASS